MYFKRYSQICTVPTDEYGWWEIIIPFPEEYQYFVFSVLTPCPPIGGLHATFYRLAEHCASPEETTMEIGEFEIKALRFFGQADIVSDDIEIGLRAVLSSIPVSEVDYFPGTSS